MNKANRQTLAEMARRMKADDDFLILTHRRPDGDTVGSAVALCIALRRLGKRAYVCANPEAPERLQRYLAPYEAQGETRDQTVVTVDIPDVYKRQISGRGRHGGGRFAGAAAPNGRGWVGCARRCQISGGRGAGADERHDEPRRHGQ